MSNVSTPPPITVSGEQKAKLAADPEIGAGNFLHRLLENGRDLDEPVIWIDPGWRSPWGETYTQVSLRELKRVVDWYAGWFHGLGVRPRDPVAVFTHVAFDLLVSYISLTGIGAIPTLMNGSFTPDVAADFMRRVGVVGLFADEARCEAVRPLQGSGPLRFVRSSSSLLASEGAPLPPWYPYAHFERDPVLITHSSGTTGAPKPVLMQHQNFFFAVRYRLRMPLPDGSERILSALPCSHNSAITMAMFGLLHGARIKLLSTQDAEQVVQEIEKFRPSMVAGFSKTFVDISELDLRGRDLSSVRLWWNSGDAVHESHVRKLMALGCHHEVEADGKKLLPGSVFVDGLGSSEMGHSLFYNVHRPNQARFARCVGQPFGFVEAVVLSEEGEKLPPNQVGRLGVKSPTVTSGYWNDSLLTWRSQMKGYWLTGDLVYRDDQGRFYHMDRVTDAIHTERGTLYSLQVEELLMATHPEIAECTVIGIPGEDGSQRACGFLQLREDAAGDLAEWGRRVNETLGQQGLPPLSRVVRVQKGELLVGVTGKVKKRELRERCHELLARSVEISAPAAAAVAGRAES